MLCPLPAQARANDRSLLRADANFQMSMKGLRATTSGRP
jgi:hypothetical protein